MTRPDHLDVKPGSFARRKQSNWVPWTVSFLVCLGSCGMVGHWLMEIVRGRESRTWPSVAGVLDNVGATRRGSSYRYEVDGRQYRSNRVRFAWGRKHDYRQGDTIRVYVNPNDPGDAVLYPQPHLMPGIPLFFGFWILIAGGLCWLAWPPWAKG